MVMVIMIEKQSELTDKQDKITDRVTVRLTSRR